MVAVFSKQMSESVFRSVWMMDLFRIQSRFNESLSFVFIESNVFVPCDAGIPRSETVFRMHFWHVPGILESLRNTEEWIIMKWSLMVGLFSKQMSESVFRSVWMTDLFRIQSRFNRCVWFAFKEYDALVPCAAGMPQNVHSGQSAGQY